MVHSGLLDIMQSDDEIAAVLGHEAAHVLARHVVSFCRSERLCKFDSMHLGSSEEFGPSRQRTCLFDVLCIRPGALKCMIEGRAIPWTD